MLNRTTVIGYVGQDPQVRSTQTGKQVANFSVAVTEKGRDGEADRTIWYACAAWGELSEVVKAYVRQGRQVLVEGKVGYDVWADKHTGTPTGKLTLTVFKMELLGKREAEQQTSTGAWDGYDLEGGEAQDLGPLSPGN